MRRERARWPVWIADRLPAPVLANSERGAVNVGMGVLALLALLPDDWYGGLVIGSWPWWLQTEWGGGMLAAVAFSLHGYWTGARPSERVGSAGMALGCLMYAVQAILALGWLRGTGVAVLMATVALAKLVRVVRSLAVQAEQVRRFPRDGSSDG